MNRDNKLKKLKNIISEMDSCLVAFSGGVDSTFLLFITHAVLKDKCLAVTAQSLTYPDEELWFSKRLARSMGVRQEIIRTNELKNKEFILNPVNRCYFCKHELFSRLKDIARQEGLRFVVDASNVSDRNDYRPGNRAKKELKIRSPLIEAGFTKADIRKASKRLGLVTWQKPNLACLASRIPYGTKISPGLLNRIHRAELILRNSGFIQARLRHHNRLCRIEVPYKEIPKILDKRDLLVEKLKKLGYNYITLDLQGYRTGSLNELIKK